MSVIQKRQDYFLKHTPDKPKLEVAQYVFKELKGRSINGMKFEPVKTYKYSEAKKVQSNGKEIRARSEHKQDYDGVSGMLDSPLLSHQAITDEKSIKLLLKDGDFKKGSWSINDHLRTTIVGGPFYSRLFHEITERIAIFQSNMRKAQRAKERAPGDSSFNAKRYCELLGLNENRFWKGVSFSYWENLQGYNLTISADSAINGRYHIIVHKPSCYVIIENGKIKYQSHKLPSDASKGVLNSPYFYEEVRNLQKFDPSNCPIMEAQVLDNSFYFLQYLRGRDFEPAAFVLERPPNANEFVALFCRGSTSPDYPDGEIHKIKVFNKHIKSVSPPGESVLQYQISHMLSELSVRQQNLHIIPADALCRDDNKNIARRLMVGQFTSHGGISKLLKPRISLLTLQGPLGDKRYLDEFQAKVIADGRKAYIEVL
ncbi:MAG: hypothetical protein NTX79_05880 [Candidatus Micrarchaeota archaeon]|nr:hypothetical protein [Candidatus Micrarchaeota archaeon]